MIPPCPLHPFADEETLSEHSPSEVSLELEYMDDPLLVGQASEEAQTAVDQAAVPSYVGPFASPATTPNSESQQTVAAVEPEADAAASESSLPRPDPALWVLENIPSKVYQNDPAWPRTKFLLTTHSVFSTSPEEHSSHNARANYSGWGPKALADIDREAAKKAPPVYAPRQLRREKAIREPDEAIGTPILYFMRSDFPEMAGEEATRKVMVKHGKREAEVAFAFHADSFPKQIHEFRPRKVRKGAERRIALPERDEGIDTGSECDSDMDSQWSGREEDSLPTVRGMLGKREADQDIPSWSASASTSEPANENLGVPNEEQLAISDDPTISTKNLAALDPSDALVPAVKFPHIETYSDAHKVTEFVQPDSHSSNDEVDESESLSFKNHRLSVGNILHERAAPHRKQTYRPSHFPRIPTRVTDWDSMLYINFTWERYKDELGED